MATMRFLRYSVLGILALFIPAGVSAADGPANERVRELSGEISALTAGSGKTVLDPRTGYARFVGADMNRAIPVKGAFPGASFETIARSFLDNYGGLFGIADQGTDLKASRVKNADRGRSFVRFQQVYDNVPVFGGEIVVQTLESSEVLSANGKILPEAAVDTTPLIGGDAAVQSALALVSKKYGIDQAALSTSTPELWVYNPTLVGPGPDVTSLVWRVEVAPADSLLPIRELILVDAHAGKVSLSFNQVPHALDRKIYTKNNVRGDTLPGTLVRSEGEGVTGDGDTDKAYDYSGDTYDFYFANHGRDSIDNAGMTLVSTVKFCRADTGYACPYGNAYWNGSQMVYGAGYASADDVVAHELTHGVTEKESGLFYYFQSGAINESLSDIWGEFVDLGNGAGDDTAGVRWLMGEDLAIGAIRSMSDPTIYGNPDRMGSASYWCSPDDQGGVHANSGVNNKAAYLVVDGGSFNGKTVTGIGVTKAAKVYYEAQTNLLVSASDYLDLYNALQQACTNLTGTAGITAADCLQVKSALDAVEMSQQPSGCAANEAPVCAAGQTPSNLFFDDMENTSSGNWGVNAAPSGADPWGYLVGYYATSGSTALYVENANIMTDLKVTMTGTVAIPAGTDPVYLRFNHAYDLEAEFVGSTGYDGGVVEYSTNGGSTWSDAGALFTDNGYTKTIDTRYSNPLAGRTAFSLISNGYTSSRVDLASLRGSSVKFRFRSGTDNSWGWDRGWYGWFVDDVRIYTCVTPPPAAPTLGTLTPSTESSASGTPKSFTAVYSDANGYANLSAVDLLVSPGTTKANAIWARYVPSVNKLFLFKDSGVGVVKSCIPGTAKILSNTQGSLNCATTTVVGSGDDLTVSWNITPRVAFSSATARNLRMFARDAGGLRSGWITKGTWTISPGGEAPELGTLAPTAVTTAAGTVRNFTAVYSDGNGYQDLATVDFLVSTGTTGVGAIFARYNRLQNKLYLLNDAGSGYAGSCVPGEATILSNSQGSLSCVSTLVEGLGNTLTVRWKLTPAPGFASATPRNLRMIARDAGGLNSGWATKGTWTITAP